MKIERIQIDGFGCHKDLILSLNNDFNILCGKNESGKSTVLAFIQAIFYGFDDGVKAPAHRTRTFWMPWQGGPFGGSLTFSHNGQRYTVLASWGGVKAEDRVSVSGELDGKMELVGNQTVGEAILQITCENFETFVLGGLAYDSGRNPNEAEQLYTMTHAEQAAKEDDSAADVKLSAYQNYLQEKQNANKQAEAALQHRKEQVLCEDAKEIQLASETEQLEAMHTELSKQETKPQSIEALTMSVSLLGRQKKVHKLYTAVEDLRYRYAEAYETRRRKILPWTIVMICLMVLDAFALVTLLIPIKPLLSLIGLAQLSSTAHTIACGVSVVLFLVISLGLILLRTGGKRSLYEVEEALQYKEQALYELLSLEDGNPDEVIEAIDLLNEQCKNATQCLSAIDRDRNDKAELARKLSELTQKITYNRAKQEMSAHFKAEHESIEDLDEKITEYHDTEARIQKHLEAVAIARTLLSQAQARQKCDLAPRLSQQSGELLDALTQGRYRTMELSRDFEPSVAKNGVLRGGKHYRGATGKQINLALKLSQMKLLADSGKALPFILDEPFTGYDEERRKQSMKALLQFAKTHNLQIVITSAQMSNTLEEALTQYALSI